MISHVDRKNNFIITIWIRLFAECIFPQSILHYFALLYTCKSTSVWMSVINFGEDETSSLKDGVLDLCTSSCCSWALEAWLLAFVILQQSKTKKTIVFCPCLFFLLHSFRIICIFETKGDEGFYAITFWCQISTLHIYIYIYIYIP